MSDNSDSDSEVGDLETILYDIVTYKEWEQEPELVRTEKKVRGGVWWWRGSSVVSGSVPAQVEKLRSVKLPWILAVSSDAGLVAVLGETTFCI